eukprot:scaffold75395_cov43-Prasinocladus_malaysianus.AAC.1
MCAPVCFVLGASTESNAPKVFLAVWQIICPEVACVFGEIQYGLLMAILFENLGEQPLLAPPRPSPYGKPGTPYAAAQPLVKVLGVDPHIPPKWEVEVSPSPWQCPIGPQLLVGPPQCFMLSVCLVIVSWLPPGSCPYIQWVCRIAARGHRSHTRHRPRS